MSLCSVIDCTMPLVADRWCEVHDDPNDEPYLCEELCLEQCQGPCGCVFKPDHQRGDRRVRCAKHRLLYRITAHPMPATYEITELPI